MTWKCLFGHDFSWGKVYHWKGVGTYAWSHEKVEMAESRQDGTCARCGYVETRIVAQG